MTSCTISDFFDTVVQAAGNGDPFALLALPDAITDTVKIHSSEWGSTSALNYRSALYMRAVQQDVLRAWNQCTKENITLASIDKRPFLIVEFQVQDGCIELTAKIHKIVGAIMEGLSPKQKILICCIVALGVAPFPVGKCISKLAECGFFTPKEIQLAKIVSESKSSSGVIINNLGNGTVSYMGRDWTKDEVNSEKKRVSEIQAVRTIMLDGNYSLDGCKMEDGRIHLVSSEGVQFQADTSMLDDASKSDLGALIGKAFTESRKLVIGFNINAKIKGGMIQNAFVVGIGDPRPGTQSKPMPSEGKTNSATLEQGSLIEAN